MIKKFQTYSISTLISRFFIFLCCCLSAGILVWSITFAVQPNCNPAVANCPDYPWDLIVPLISLGFWVVGLIAWIGKRIDIVVLFFFLSSAVLSSGLLSGSQNPLSIKLFYILLALLSPVLIHFHLQWSEIIQTRLEKSILLFSYTLAGFLIVPIMFFSTDSILVNNFFSLLRLIIRFVVVLALVIVVAVSMVQYRKTQEIILQYRIRLVFFATLLAFIPVLFLSLLPSLLGFSFLSTEINLVWLIFIPLGYGYSIFYSQLARIEKVINQFSLYYLLVILYISGFLILVKVFSLIIPAWSNNWAWMSAAIGTGLFFLVTRLGKNIRKLLDRILYGDEAAYLEVLSQLSDSLGTVLTRDKFLKLLLDQLRTLAPISGSALFLRTEDNVFSLQGSIGFSWQDVTDVKLESGNLTDFLFHAERLVENEKIYKNLSLEKLTTQEKQLLSLSGISYWIPLISSQELHGFLLVGYFQGEKHLNSADLKTWQIFARQAGITAHNVLLSEELLASRNSLEHAHQNVLNAHEQERRKLACDLHDNALQQLIGISYQVNNLQYKINHREETKNINQDYLINDLGLLKQEILEVSSMLRELIGELRPVGLDEFGIGSALDGFIERYRHQVGPDIPQIHLRIDNRLKNLPEEIAICLFRIFQEAFRNSLKHAQAKHVYVELFQDEKEVFLKVSDDGCGFKVPNQLGEFSVSGHYGLVGITERVSWINGKCSILSTPGKGTEVNVRIQKSTIMNLYS